MTITLSNSFVYCYIVRLYMCIYCSGISIKMIEETCGSHDIILTIIAKELEMS